MPKNTKDKVIIYTVNGCPFCHRAKEFLKAKNVDYTEYEISENHDKADELVELTGRALVPVTIIGNETIIGFDQEKLEQALKA